MLWLVSLETRPIFKRPNQFFFLILYSLVDDEMICVVLSSGQEPLSILVVLDQVRERPLMTSDIRVGDRSKMTKKQPTLLMDVPLSNWATLEPSDSIKAHCLGF